MALHLLLKTPDRSSGRRSRQAVFAASDRMKRSAASGPLPGLAAFPSCTVMPPKNGFSGHREILSGTYPFPAVYPSPDFWLRQAADSGCRRYDVRPVPGDRAEWPAWNLEGGPGRRMFTAGQQGRRSPGRPPFQMSGMASSCCRFPFN